MFTVKYLVLIELPEKFVLTFYNPTTTILILASPLTAVFAVARFG
jgi:hypothetical protein